MKPRAALAGSGDLSLPALSPVIKLRMCFIFISILLERLSVAALRLPSKTNVLITISSENTRARYEPGPGSLRNHREVRKGPWEIEEWWWGLWIHSLYMQHWLNLFQQPQNPPHSPPSQAYPLKVSLWCLTPLPGSKIMTHQGWSRNPEKLVSDSSS